MATDSRSVNRPAFVGRAAELARLESAVRSAGRGTRAVVILGGEAGIGKTTLVNELAERSRAAGIEVLVGGCLDLDLGTIPYAPFVEALRDLADLAGAGAAGGPGTLQAVQQVIEQLSRDRPVLLILEDVHWADRSTRDLIAFLAATGSASPLAMVVTYRSDDLWPSHPLRPFLAELERRPDVTHVRLERLGRADAAQLLKAVLGSRPEAGVVEDLYRRSEGNPFFLEELARTVTTPGTELPPLLHDVMTARFAHLTPAAQLALRVAAVGGRRVEHERLAAVVPLDDDELTAALREARDANLVIADAATGRYEFRHALLREAVYADVLPGERGRYHAAYAELIGSADATGIEHWAQLAHHWRAAGQVDAALVAAIEAGLAAEAGYAVGEADRYYDAALDLWDGLDGPPPATPLTRSELLVRAADAASRTGAFDRAVELVTGALAEVDEDEEPDRAGLLHERRAWFLLRSGSEAEADARAEEALREYERAVRLVGPDPPSTARARVLAAYADALLRSERPEEARMQAEAAIPIAIAAHAPFDEGHARHMLGLALGALGHTDEGVEELHRARVLAERNGDVADVAGTYVHLWRVLSENGRADEMIRIATDAATFCGAAGLDVSAQLLEAMAAGFLHQLGRWDEADRLLASGHRSAWGLPAVVTHLMQGMLAVDRGSLASAREHLETARSLGAQIFDGRINGLLARGLAELELWEGRPDQAMAEVSAGIERTNDDEMLARLAWLGLRAGADLAEEQRAEGHPVPAAVEDATARLERLLSRLDARAIGRRAPEASETRAAVASGRAERARRDGRAQAEQWREVERRWSRIGYRAPAAYAGWRLAGALLAGGRRADAVGPWRAAHREAVRLGARPLQVAIEDEAARAFVPLVDDLSPGGLGEASGEVRPYNLTPRELEVLTLVAAGRTNRQIGDALFISEKTASVHVSRILAKLDVTSRAQAAALAGRLGLSGAPGPAAGH